MAPAQTPESRRSVLKKGGLALGIGSLGLVGPAAGQNGTNQTNGNGGGGGELEITLATTQPPENVSVQAAQDHFIQPLEEQSNGRITVNLEAATLGGTEDNLAALEAGTADIVHESPTALSQRYATQYSFAGDPFVIRDMQHYRSVYEEFLAPSDGLNGILQENGIRLGDAFYVGNRSVTSNMPVRKPEDIQGVKMRLPQYETWTTVWSEIGADVTPVAYDELYSALQTGVVEASEGPISQFLAVSLYEVQSHFSVTNHLLDTKHFLYNEEFFQGLSSDDQELITSVASDAVENMSRDIRAQEEELYERARNEGTTIVPAEDVDRPAFVEAGMPALRRLSEERWPVTIDEILELAGTGTATGTAAGTETTSGNETATNSTTTS